MRLFVFLMSVSCLSLVIQASESHRDYAGSMDEDRLKVQPTVFTPEEVSTRWIEREVMKTLEAQTDEEQDRLPSGE